MAYGDIVIGDDGWTEIVGEQTRGGGGTSDSLTPVLGRDDESDLDWDREEAA